MPCAARAETLSSTNFRVYDASINTIGGGRATSTGFTLVEYLGQLAAGTSSATSFRLNAGLLSYPTTTIPVVTATAGDASASLSWTAAVGSLGWTVSGYTVGQSTAAGGPYTYTSLGNVTSSNRTGLSNGTAYYFVILPEDAFGTTIATSSEVSTTPVAAAETSASSGGGVVSVPSVTSSGSSGREIIGPWLTAATFNGTAYPKSVVTILKGGSLVALKRVPANGRFSISVPNISVGAHTFGIWAEDTEGYRSITRTFTVTVKYGEAVSVSGIVLPPTIATDKKEVRIDDAITVFGKTAPEAKVMLYADDNREALTEIQAEKDGTWRWKLSARLLGDGSHTVRARTKTGEIISTFSQTAAFTVGLKNILLPAPREVPAHVDFNSDKKVNLVDFSIAAFWYKRTKPPVHVDPNKDGKVDLKDFSILAYWWTG